MLPNNISDMQIKIKQLIFYVCILKTSPQTESGRDQTDESPPPPDPLPGGQS